MSKLQLYFRKTGMPRKVKTIILFTFIAALFLHLLSTIPGIYKSYKYYKLATRAYLLNEISDNLYSAVNNYGFERGRANVILNDAGPVVLMEKNREFVLARRAEGDSKLTNALSGLSAVEIQNADIYIDDIKKIKLKVDELRNQIRTEMLVPKTKRNDDLPKLWFKTMTDYIGLVQDLQTLISGDISNTDVTIYRFSTLKNKIMELRNIIAPEMSILSGVILSGKPISPELKVKIESLKEDTKLCFKTIELLNSDVSSPLIDKELQNLKRVYSDAYMPYRDVIFPAALAGGPYPYSQQEFLEHGVKALHQIAEFNTAVVRVTSEYTTRFRDEQKHNILFQLFSSAGSFLIMVLMFGYLHYWVINPIARLTSIINQLSSKDLNIQVPYTNAKNEIGELANSINIFKTQKEDLEAALSRVKQLEGIIPICMYCKKIRDDEQSWHQLEQYITNHSEALFSHGICPDCYADIKKPV